MLKPSNYGTIPESPLAGSPHRQESSRALRLRPGGRPGHWERDETRRNTFQGHPAAFFYASQAEHYRPRRSQAFTFIATSDVLHGLDLYFSRFRYQDQSSGLKIA